jgi:DNA-binding CsgD family transcriptional regulator
VLSALAAAHAQLGEAEAATTAVVELDRLPASPFSEPEQDLSRAWALAVSGDLPGGRDVLLAAAARAGTTGYRISEAALLHDVARLGAPSSVVRRLDELAGECEGGLVAAYVAHAAAAAAGDAAALVAAADDFERLGALLLAAESATEAAQASQNDGDRRIASSLSARAAALAASCQGARTPALATTVAVSPLTPRERDIAAFAAGGESSKDIAERLFLSVRTVNNHLQSVYSKLGITGRHELTAALEVSPSPSPPGRRSSSAPR